MLEPPFVLQDNFRFQDSLKIQQPSLGGFTPLLCRLRS